MPRKARIVLPRYPHHIVHRGHNRSTVFGGEADYRRYLDSLRELKEACGVRVYAYCLMTNHVHLLLTPSDEAGLGQLMKRLAARQTRYRNRTAGRTGTLWESRYKSSPVDADAYLLACVRYIEMNPVRAGMVAAPGDYPWSSFNARAGKVDAAWLDPAPGVQPPSNGGAGAGASAARGEPAVPEHELALIRSAVARGQLTGGERFVEQVRRLTGQRVEPRGRGRPPRRR